MSELRIPAGTAKAARNYARLLEDGQIDPKEVLEVAIATERDTIVRLLKLNACRPIYDLIREIEEV